MSAFYLLRTVVLLSGAGEIFRWKIKKKQNVNRFNAEPAFSLPFFFYARMMNEDILLLFRMAFENRIKIPSHGGYVRERWYENELNVYEEIPT